MSIKTDLEEKYLLPCGGVSVKADSVCRKTLTASMVKVLDRLTQEVNPEPPPSEKLPKNTKVSEDGKIVPKETTEERRQRLIEEGKLRAEVRSVVKQYQESLQGNSKLLQDITGKIQPW